MTCSSSERALALAALLGTLAGLPGCTSGPCAETCHGCCQPDGTCASCDPDAGVGDVPQSPLSFFDLYVSQFCARMQQCQLIATGVDCPRALALEFDRPLFVSASHGLATFDRDNAAQCLNAVATVTCQNFSLEVCDIRGALSRMGNSGDTCLVDDECNGVCAGTACSRSCVDDMPAGSPCYGFCGINSTCASGICKRLPTAGQQCTTSCAIGSLCTGGNCIREATVGELCPSSNPYCFDSYCNAGVCAAYKADGEKCASYNECQHGCDSYLGVCVGYNAVAQPGAYCSDYVDCPRGYQCVGEARSPYVGRCVKPQLGDVCATSYDCGPGAACQTSSNHCVPTFSGAPCAYKENCVAGELCLGDQCDTPAAVGASCKPYGCVAGAFCRLGSGSTGACVAYSDLHGPCTSANDCRFGLTCKSSSCVAIDVGDPCFAYCPTGQACLRAADAGYECRPAFANGQPCDNSTQCTSLACVNGACAEACP